MEPPHTTLNDTSIAPQQQLGQDQSMTTIPSSMGNTPSGGMELTQIVTEPVTVISPSDASEPASTIPSTAASGGGRDGDVLAPKPPQNSHVDPHIDTVPPIPDTALIAEESAPSNDAMEEGNVSQPPTTETLLVAIASQPPTMETLPVAMVAHHTVQLSTASLSTVDEKNLMAVEEVAAPLGPSSLPPPPQVTPQDDDKADDTANADVSPLPPIVETSPLTTGPVADAELSAVVREGSISVAPMAEEKMSAVDSTESSKKYSEHLLQGLPVEEDSRKTSHSEEEARKNGTFRTESPETISPARKLSSKEEAAEPESVQTTFSQLESPRKGVHLIESSHNESSGQEQSGRESLEHEVPQPSDAPSLRNAPLQSDASEAPLQSDASEAPPQSDARGASSQREAPPQSDVKAQRKSPKKEPLSNEQGLESFETPEDAVASLPHLDPINVDELSAHETDNTTRRPNKRGRRESGDGLPVAGRLSRKDSRRPSTRDDDTEPEQHTKPKKRKTLLSRHSTSGIGDMDSSDSVTEMTLSAVPDGWKQPLLYFVEGRPYDYHRNEWVKEEVGGGAQASERRNAKWLRLGDLLVKTGAIYLTATETGSPDAPDHAVGPTAIIRDLCAIVQSGASDPVPLHLGAYTALGRANAREHMNLKAHRWDCGIGMTRVVKAGNEKECVQLLPFDLIGSCVANNLRAMLSHTSLFPGHLFANPMHVLQFAPTLSMHLDVLNRPPKISEVVRVFVDAETDGRLEEMEVSYNRRIGGSRATGGRRRLTNKAKEHLGLRTFVMTPADKQEVQSIIESLEAALVPLRKVTQPATVAYPEAEFGGRSFGEGSTICEELTIPLLSLSSAAMRTQIWKYYDIRPCMIDLWADALPDRTLRELLKHLTKENERWIMGHSDRIFLDFTLSEQQEEWLLARSRREIHHKVPMPPTPPALQLIQHLLTHPTDDVSESAHNCELSVSLIDETTKGGDLFHAAVSLKAVRNVDSNEKLVLSSTHQLVSWEDLANNEADLESSSSQP